MLYCWALVRSVEVVEWNLTEWRVNESNAPSTAMLSSLLIDAEVVVEQSVKERVSISKDDSSGIMTSTSPALFTSPAVRVRLVRKTLSIETEEVDVEMMGAEKTWVDEGAIVIEMS